MLGWRGQGRHIGKRTDAVASHRKSLTSLTQTDKRRRPKTLTMLSHMCNNPHRFHAGKRSTTTAKGLS